MLEVQVPKSKEDDSNLADLSLAHRPIATNMSASTLVVPLKQPNTQSSSSNLAPAMYIIKETE